MTHPNRPALYSRPVRPPSGSDVILRTRGQDARDPHRVLLRALRHALHVRICRAHRKRLGQFKTLSKGMKNWVMSDDTSLDEAMAAARNDDDRELTSQQLDAFHATFNFCMTCRQYTCGNCWNTAEGRCLTCAPLADDFLERPLARLRPAGSPTNGHAAGAAEPPRGDALAWPTTDRRIEPEPEPEPEIVEPAAAASPAPEPAKPSGPDRLYRPPPGLPPRRRSRQSLHPSRRPPPRRLPPAAVEPAAPPAGEPPVKRRSGRAARSAELLAKFQPGRASMPRSRRSRPAWTIRAHGNRTSANAWLPPRSPRPGVSRRRRPRLPNQSRSPSRPSLPGSRS